MVNSPALVQKNKKKKILTKIRRNSLGCSLSPDEKNSELLSGAICKPFYIINANKELLNKLQRD